jgi:DNA-binding transcriptional regulator YiaG
MLPGSDAPIAPTHGASVSSPAAYLRQLPAQGSHNLENNQYLSYYVFNSSKQLVCEAKMIDLIDLGNEIKNARRQRKLTREKLAELSGVSRARIESLENGRASDMGFKGVLTLMNIVGLDFRLTTFNHKRPTLEDIMEEDDAPRLGR